jgi:hypothetical protein
VEHVLLLPPPSDGVLNFFTGEWVYHIQAAKLRAAGVKARPELDRRLKGVGAKPKAATAKDLALWLAAIIDKHGFRGLRAYAAIVGCDYGAVHGAGSLMAVQVLYDLDSLACDGITQLGTALADSLSQRYQTKISERWAITVQAERAAREPLEAAVTAEPEPEPPAGGRQQRSIATAGAPVVAAPVPVESAIACGLRRMLACYEDALVFDRTAKEVRSRIRVASHVDFHSSRSTPAASSTMPTDTQPPPHRVPSGAATERAARPHCAVRAMRWAGGLPPHTAGRRAAVRRGRGADCVW